MKVGLERASRLAVASSDEEKPFFAWPFVEGFAAAREEGTLGFKKKLGKEAAFNLVNALPNWDAATELIINRPNISISFHKIKSFIWWEKHRFLFTVEDTR